MFGGGHSELCDAQDRPRDKGVGSGDREQAAILTVATLKSCPNTTEKTVYAKTKSIVEGNGGAPQEELWRLSMERGPTSIPLDSHLLPPYNGSRRR